MSLSRNWLLSINWLMQSGPLVIVWCIGIYLCFTRRKENPKGALFLRNAILISLFTLVIDRLPFFWRDPFTKGSAYWIGEAGIWALLAFKSLLTIVIWAFIIAAVFARPAHYDFSDRSAFDDNSQ
jgi:hypothetical protein